MAERDPYGDKLDELPPNVPPGFLGEQGLNFGKVDSSGPHGLNAGVIQEWTWETTRMIIALTYFLFFPLSFVILWRTRYIARKRKIALSVVMAAGLVFVGWRLFP